MKGLSIAIVLGVAACGHPTKQPDKPKNGSGTTTVVKTDDKKPPVPGADPVLPDIGCPTNSCAFHPGSALYLTCTAGGAGVCFHFGAACAPADKCMYDPNDRTYKTCNTAVEGACTAFAGACAPSSKCMVEPTTGLYRHCDSPSGGKCASYGAVCAPSA